MSNIFGTKNNLKSLIFSILKVVTKEHQIVASFPQNFFSVALGL